MKYIAEDGYEIISEKNKNVQYVCKSSYTDGIYESYETCGCDNMLGISQIKIVREVYNGICVYTITESTDFELIEYLNSINKKEL